MPKIDLGIEAQQFERLAAQRLRRKLDGFSIPTLRSAHALAIAAGDSDIEAPYQAILYLKDMTDSPVGQEIAPEVAHGLVDLDCDDTITFRPEIDRLDMRVDHRPLTCPVGANAVVAVHMAAFHSVRP
jgi:hypothetical protein